MKICTIVPMGWRCTFRECPPGFFMIAETLDAMSFDNKNEIEAVLFFKSEYSDNDDKQVAYCPSGEYFWGGADSVKARNNIMVQPVTIEWKEVE